MVASQHMTELKPPFLRQALRLDPHIVITNRTGVPLQLMEPRPNAQSEGIGGAFPEPHTPSGMPRTRGPASGQQSPPQGLRALVSEPGTDWASCVGLPPGALSPPFAPSARNPWNETPCCM